MNLPYSRHVLICTGPRCGGERHSARVRQEFRREFVRQAIPATVRETEMASEIAVEQQRSTLVESRVENERKEAEARGAALRAVLDPVRDVDWRTLLAMQGSARSDLLIASAFDQFARNAEKIGQLNISPDLLTTLLQVEKEKNGA